MIHPHGQNSIVIPLANVSCCKAEFDSTYPARLNGIITQTEFHESIRNINRSAPSRIYLVAVGFLGFLCVFIGFALFIINGATMAISRMSTFSIFLIAGITVFVLGMIILGFGCCLIQVQRTNQMRRSIAKESVKYSNRSPVSCSWRLLNSREWIAGYGMRQRSRLVQQLLIEIGNPTMIGNGFIQPGFNQYGIQSTSSYTPQFVAPSAPPAYDECITGFCSNCGKAKSNFSANFCSSCGQAFNKF